VNLLKSWNKEQWAAAAAVVLGALMLATGLAGGVSSGTEAPLPNVEKVFSPLTARFSDFPDDKFDRYWQGRDIFKGDSASKLPIPPIKPPDPRDEDLAAPFFRPGVATDVYNGLDSKAIKVKYPGLVPQAPVVPDADLPSAAVVEELKKLVEPAVEARPDRRAEKEREYFTLYTRNDAKPRLGRLIVETPTHIRYQPKDSQGSVTVEKANLLRWEYNRTNEEIYRIDSQKIPSGPKEAEERTKLARRLLDLGMVKEARDELQKAIAARPDHTEAILLLGQLAVDVADYDQAIALYETGIGSNANAADLWCEIGRCHRALQFTEGALLAFEKALEASPRHQNAKLGLGRAMLDLGQHAEAANQANEFFTRMAGSGDTTTAQKVEGFLISGLALLRGGNLERARVQFGEALKLDPQSAEAINGQAVPQALEGNYRDAAQEFLRAIKINQYLTEAWTNFGTLLLLGGRPADAEAVFRAASDRDPSSVDAVLGQGMALLLAGKKEADAMLDRAAAMNPRHPQVLSAQGYARLRAGQDEEALVRYTGALRADYSYLPAYSGAAAAYLRTARKMAADAAQHHDDQKAAEMSRRAQERRIAAETLLRTVRDFDPNRPSGWEALGCAYASMGRPAEAQDALRRAAMLLQAAGKPADPLVSYALGYVEYYFAPLESEEARLESAQREFSQGAGLKAQVPSTDLFSQRAVADCQQAVDAIEDWKVTSLLLNDAFEREASKAVGNGWIQADTKYGIAITLENTKETGGRARFLGKQAITNYGLTTLQHDVVGDNFYAVEATLYPDKTNRVEYGLSIFFASQGDSRIGFHVGLDGAGKLRFNSNAPDKDLDRRDMLSAGGWTEIKAPIPNPREILLRVTRGQKNRAEVFTIWLFDPSKSEWVAVQKEVPVNIQASRGNWRVGFFSRAPQDAEVSFGVDNVRVFARMRR
jgi:tetratricopeptide (TPR) repeat protein